MNLYAYYKNKIDNKEYKPAEKLPTEAEIGKLFNVSRITVRQALDYLENNNYITRIQGKGSFVKFNKTSMQVNKLVGFSEEMIKKGLIPSTKLLKVTKVASDEKISRELNIEIGTIIYEIQRIRYANNIPMCIEIVYIPFFKCPDIEKENLSQSFYAILKNKYNINVSHAKQVVEAGVVTVKDAEILQIKQGFPVLLISRTTYLNDQSTIEYVNSIYAGDKYKLTLDIIANN